uniref:Uncharacterized protein n=1 Tax=Salmonella enterica subsp. salamae TaxID=59202 RepID=I3W428_SALER|nr:hypothetical protein [Salmonella enterica subsp. salamae]
MTLHIYFRRNKYAQNNEPVHTGSGSSDRYGGTVGACGTSGMLTHRCDVMPVAQISHDLRVTSVDEIISGAGAV